MKWRKYRQLAKISVSEIKQQQYAASSNGVAAAGAAKMWRRLASGIWSWRRKHLASSSHGENHSCGNGGYRK
jgi:hypothetical protein